MPKNVFRQYVTQHVAASKPIRTTFSTPMKNIYIPFRFHGPKLIVSREVPSYDRVRKAPAQARKVKVVRLIAVGVWVRIQKIIITRFCEINISK